MTYTKRTLFLPIILLLSLSFTLLVQASPIEREAQVQSLATELTSTQPSAGQPNSQCSIAASSPIRYVDQASASAIDGTNSCTNAATPCLTIQHAIDQSSVNDVVRVAPGTYVENIDYTGKDITIASDFYWTGDRADIANTIINGNQNGSVVTMINGESVNAQMIGFTITDGSGTYVDDTGYGPTSSGSYRGGGFYVRSAQPMLCDLVITNNAAAQGGAMYSLRSEPTISGTIVQGNQSSFVGGGLYFESHSQYHPSLINTVVADNQAVLGGGIFANYSTQLELTHVTIADNTASSMGGGILRANAGTISMTNSIVWGNAPATIDWHGGTSKQSFVIDSDVEATGDPHITYSGTILTIDPLFVGGGDYHLTSSSPVIDQGTPSAVTVDLEHTVRSALPDMGAYEHIVQIPNSQCSIADSSAMRYVDQANASALDGANSCMNAATPCLTIQHAIDQSSVNDVVRVAPGTYVENIDYTGKDITIASDFYWTGDRADIANTIINGNQNGSVVTMINGESVNAQMIGFTITDGSGTYVDDTGYGPTSSGSYRGGGFYVRSAQPMLCDLVITDNAAAQGGAMYSLRSEPTISGTVVQGNQSSFVGGGLYFESHSQYHPSLINTVVADNQAVLGGGIFANYSTQLELTHVTIADNTASSMGGGILRANAGTISMTNSIVWGNAPATIDWQGGTSKQSYVIDSDVEATGDPHITYSGTILTVDPLFVGGGDYHLTSSSPVIDQGTPSAVTVDLEHTGRSALPDMGAYEHVAQVPNTQCSIADSSSMRYVDQANASAIDGANSCTNAATPCLTIQHAIDQSSVNDVVRVAPGTYVENIDYTGKDITIASNFYWTGDRADIANTIINGNQNGSVVTMINGESVNAQMIGFTITDGSGTYVDDTGYGPTSSGSYRGGGFYVRSAQPMLCDLVITDNAAAQGGAMYSLRSEPTISGTIVQGNQSSFVGGGLYFESHSQYHPSLINTVVADNQAVLGGGVFANYSTQLELTHVTIADNTASSMGGGILRANAGTISMTNSIVWGNAPATIDWHGGTSKQSYVIDSDVEATGDPHITYSGTILTVDPLFVGGGDYHLTSSSPVIDQGTPSAVTVDLEHTGRSALPDMGAYESTTVSQSLLAVYAYAGDNDRNSPANLMADYSGTIDGLIAATSADSSKTAVVLADLDQDGDTHILHIANGVVTPINGLPDASAALDPMIFEYNMTDGDQVGAFIEWARATYAASTTTFTYIGHGTFLTPDTDIAVLLNGTRTSSLFPLPTWVDAGADLTDHTSMAVISPHDLAVALARGTNDGANPLDVADITHCFAASIEEFYELSNADGSPYATVMTGAPNYAYFAGEMPGAALTMMDVGDSAENLATSILTAYSDVLDAANNVDGDPDVDHPALLVAVESASIPAIKDKIDEMAWYIDAEFDTDAAATVTKLSDAYLSTGFYYDTTFCQPQDWELAAPDALVDAAPFMQQLATKFGTFSGVGLRALQTDALIDAAVIETRGTNGTPWFGSSASFWNLAATERGGLSLYADMAGRVDGSTRYLSWQAAYYHPNVTATNPNPYQFVLDGSLGTSWATVFNRYWDTREMGEGLTLETEACLPEFPPSQQAAELAVTQLIFPHTGTLNVNYASPVAAAVSTDGVAVNPLVQFNIYDSSGTVVFTDTVGAGLLITGTHQVSASADWTPTATGVYTLEVTVDVDNRFIEVDESDNTLTRLDNAVNNTPFMLTATVASDLQWFNMTTVPLELDSSAPVSWLIMQLYTYVAGDDPNTQVPVLSEELLIPAPTLPNQDITLPAAIGAGNVTAHIWGVSSAGVLNQSAEIDRFNFAPTNFNGGVGQTYYLFDASAGDDMDISLDVTTGDVSMIVWEPNNPYSALVITGTGNIPFNPARTGEYLVLVEGNSADAAYTVTSDHDGTFNGRGTTSDVTVVQRDRPMFVEPMQDTPSFAPTAVTLNSAEINPSSTDFWMISALLIMLMATVLWLPNWSKR